ncbi:MAG: type II toxin-antitoxin system HipA family toxin [Nocardioides sp.]|uniref:type II toxin-antitoxin system HipA family toxin n=1 Tax=Nocardioides sp. TaxID=35761 RepID=UPI003F0A62B2
MTSDQPAPQRVFVWVWLPGSQVPVVAGAVDELEATGRLTFTYARSYRARSDAVPLFTPELPLVAGRFDPGRPGTLPDGSRNTYWRGSPDPQSRSALDVHGCLRDSAPDAWGRRVINLAKARDPEAVLDERTYWLDSNSDRIGALDFQLSPTDYVPRGGSASLEELQAMTARVEAGLPVPPDLLAAAGHGTSIGGARPKALLEDADGHHVAKFHSSTDVRPVVQAEAVAMLLAAEAGVEVAPVRVEMHQNRPALLVERFDRADGCRRMMVSALTVLGLREAEARYASYTMLAEAMMSSGWADGAQQMTELFTRAAVNVAVGNTDDHLRNHAAFFDGHQLRLTPAYDVSPQPRNTSIASHAISFDTGGPRLSRFADLVAAAPAFRLTQAHAREIVDHVVEVVTQGFAAACDAAMLTRAQATMLWGREFLNRSVFYTD